ncbi:MAG: ATP phosphoribosyltransferase [Candidatus Marinimicrobia bacterium]|nr:ATP phosphoribosyltransferase [Candidatus Neomarinimicrobiota bacterium]
MPKILKMGLPKGSLQESTLSIFKKAGWNFIISSRTYNPYCDDPELEAMFIRAQEIARYVEQGIFDAGITGWDWVLENGADVVEVCELVYAKASMRPVRWVLAVPEESSIQSVADLEGKHISTEVVNLTRRYLEEHNVTAEVEFSWGATEAKARLLSDAIVEVTETGSSLRANKLRIVDTILESTTRLIANRRAFEDPWKRRKIENMALLLQSGIMATSRVGLKMNVTNENLEKVMAVLPAMKTPTVSQLYNGSGAAIEVIVEKTTVRDIIPSLIKAGASDIIEYPLNKVIP